MKLKALAISLLVTILIASLSSTTTVTAQAGTYEKFGPRVNDLIFRVAASLTNEATEFEQGLIDYMDWAVPSGKLGAWGSDPNIVLEDYSEAGWYEIDLNLMMWPLGHGPMNETNVKTKWGSPAPTPGMDWTFPSTWTQGHYWIDYTDQRDIDAKYFRKAVASLVNRGQISSQFPGVTTPMETFIFPMLAGWDSPTVPKYPYNVQTAKDLLDAGGFKDYDGDGRREYNMNVALRNAWTPGSPAPAGTEEIPDIQLLRRTDDEIRSFAGTLLYNGLTTVGVFVDDVAGGYSQLTPSVWDNYNYHLYTGGWGWGSMPDMYYELWHSSRDTYPSTDGDGYNRYHRQAYDTLAENFKFALDLDTARTNIYAAEDMMHDDVPSIPLYTMAGSVAHRKYYGDFPGGEQLYKGLPWQGFSDEVGYGYYGLNFGYSSINAHPQGYERGTSLNPIVLRHGLINPPDKIDPVDSESFYEALIISKIYEPLIVRDPFNSTRYIPWLVSSFQPGTWNNGTALNSKVTVVLRSNILWHDNMPLTPADVEFSWWYKREAMSVAEITSAKEYNSSIIVGNTIDILFNVPSFLAVSWLASLTIIPKHIWQAYPPTLPGDPQVPGSWSFNPEAADKLIGTGPFRAFKNGVPGRLDISPGRDYIHLSANPTYHRELVQPDFAMRSGGVTVPGHDNTVNIIDFGMIIGKYGDAKPWTDTTWGPIADVNKDYLVDLDDIMETGARFGQTGYNGGYPPGYT